MEANRIYKPSRFSRYTIVPTSVFRLKGITAGATGLYCYLFSHEVGQSITIKFITNHFKEGRDAINARLKELEKHNLLVRTAIKDKGKFAGYSYYLNDLQTLETDNGKTVTENPHQSNNKNISNIDTNSTAYKSLEHFIALFPEKYRPTTDNQRYKWYQCLDRIERLDKYNLRDVYKVCQKLRTDEFWSVNFLTLLKLRNLDKNNIKFIDRFMDKYSIEAKPKCYYKIKGIVKYFKYEQDNQLLLGAKTKTVTLYDYNLRNVFNDDEYNLIYEYTNGSDKE